jgi:hypothetical protein
MLRTILVRLDGSPMAEQGLTSACRLARETGATPSLVRGVLYFTLDPMDHEADRRAVREAGHRMACVARREFPAARTRCAR